MTEEKADEVEVILTDAGRRIDYRGKQGARRSVVVDRRWEVVSRDGEVLGIIRYGMLTRETRSEGRTYVNSRWRSPGWTYERTGPRTFGCARGIEVRSKRDAIDALVSR